MAISSYPFDNQDTTEDQYTKLFAELQNTGVAGSADSLDLKVTASGSTMQLDIAAGRAFVRGHMFESTAIEHVTLTAPASGTQVHVVVLQLDPATNGITFAVHSGVPNAGYPSLADSLTVNATGLFELALASIQVNASTVAVIPGDITDQRTFVGHHLGVWQSDNLRPKAPRVGNMGYNLDTKSWEFWTGTEWEEVNGVAPGTVEMTLASTTRPGYLPLDGSTYNRADYPRLSAVLGGTGTTFTLPDMRDRGPLGASASHPLKSTGGSDQVTLTTAQLPAHKHSINHNHGETATDGAHDHDHWTSKSNGSVVGIMKTGALPGVQTDSSDYGVTAGRSAHHHTIPNYTGDSGNTGGGAAVDVLNPFLAVNFIVKV